ncbi:MAG: GTP-binding protein [Gammaproteobacteria bacterium]|nr:GTP-binding protein [Gammaproteobacteria bacterium]
MSGASRYPVLPVWVITGFLGSGKTTLVNRLLRDRPRSAVVINEFGAVPIDQKLIEHSGAPLAVLSGGCLCCQVRTSMAPLLRNLWMAWRERDERPFDRILIETSGVASPGPVLDTLLCDRWLAQRFRLQAVVTTVSALDGSAQVERFPEAVAQIALADALLITHGDLGPPAAADRLAATLDRLAPATPRIAGHPDTLGFDALLALGSGASGFRPVKGADIEHGFRSLTLRLEAPVDAALLQCVLADLLHRHGERLVRVKGLLPAMDGGLPLVLQAAAGRLYPPVPVAGPLTDPTRGQLVFIGTGPIDDLAQAVVAALTGGIRPPTPRGLH